MCSWHTRAAPPRIPPTSRLRRVSFCLAPARGEVRPLPAESFNAKRSRIDFTDDLQQTNSVPAMPSFLVPPHEACTRIKRFLRERDGDLCHWCKRPMIFGPVTKAEFGQRATLEHLLRKADGGKTRPENLALACLRCNSQRHTPGWTPPPSPVNSPALPPA